MALRLTTHHNQTVTKVAVYEAVQETSGLAQIVDPVQLLAYNTVKGKHLETLAFITKFVRNHTALENVATFMESFRASANSTMNTSLNADRPPTESYDRISKSWEYYKFDPEEKSGIWTGGEFLLWIKGFKDNAIRRGISEDNKLNLLL